ncbi:MAG: dTDP-4-dehydrorhamnose reductase [Verrucomicrobia bacterium]|nr:MAG: dTDP-4-dehydrorhamnose reductase [Verrucomicrobiota bacterium]PYL59189.1 MAG: dTDP-4-dehydrorhamnose reductase [Verrucomicrobiota bacterium]
MKIVILGAGGRLGSALMREYREKFDVTGFNHAQLDLSDHAQLREKLGTCDIDLVINTAAFANVDLCETQREEAFRINAEAPRVLAEICRDKNAKLIHFSTDYVFDGEKREPYTEDDVAKPISVYGESKWEGEKLVLQTHGHLVVRVSWVFGPDRPSFIDGMIKRARESDQVDAIADKISTPTYTRDIAQALPQFFDSDVPGGILHFASSGECSWQEYAQWAIDCCHAEGVPLKATTVEPRRMSDMKNWIAPRPVYSVLSTAKYTALTGIAPRSWRDVVGDYVKGSYSKK